MYRHSCQNPGCDVSILGHPAQRYCSARCRQAAYRLRRKSRTKSVRAQREVRCRNCGVLFTTSQPAAEFHNTSCRVSFWQQQKRLDDLEWLIER